MADTNKLPAAAPKAPPAWARDLSPVEMRFVQEYVIDLNGMQAALRAGLGGKNKNKKSAGSVAARIKKRAHVASAITALLAEQSGVTASAIVGELGAIGFSRITDYLKLENGRLALAVDDLKDLPDEAAAAISKLRERVWDDGTITIEVELHDKVAALNMLAKATPFFKERGEIKHSVEIEEDDPLDRIRARIDQLIKNNQAFDASRGEIDAPVQRPALPPAAKVGPIIDAEAIDDAE
jgi:phage terminase small subunit